MEFLKHHHGKLKDALTELLLVCGIVVPPKLAQKIDLQSAKILPLLKVLEATLLFNIGM